ncbi:MAG: sigma-70 family RNA polymerase sigma factor [Pyrinomonadaceae bacterium]|nr:sigma-70 family RNA polymerase sigma factor [Pyrinomonadaceae bacterium]
MSDHNLEDVTCILQEWGAGNRDAHERLMPLVYGELRRLARQYLYKERSGHTLQPTALVHEAYLRLIDQTRVTWQNRAHFYGVAAQLMRRILVDHARAHTAEKRGGDMTRFTLDEAQLHPQQQKSVDLLALDEALQRLAKIDERKSRVVEMRFFGGLKEDEIAVCLNVSTKTVMREWKIAKLWLYRELTTTGAERVISDE